MSLTGAPTGSHGQQDAPWANHGQHKRSPLLANDDLLDVLSKVSIMKVTQKSRWNENATFKELASLLSFVFSGASKGSGKH